MSFITDGINKIKRLIFKTTPALNAANRDLILESKLNSDTMRRFENPNNFNDYCRDFFSKSKNFEEQLDYVELITQMMENGSMNDYKEYLKYVENNPGLYYPSDVHGVGHTSRVLFYAEMLSMLDNLSEHDKNLIMISAQLHDIGREDDSKNFDHGLASKQKIEYYNILQNFSEKDAEIIKFAVECHSLSKDQVKEKLNNINKKDRLDFKKVLDYLQDADKLDRTRIANKGWGLDPNRLTTDTAKKLVKVAHQNFYEYHNVMRYDKNLQKTDLFGNKLIDYFQEVRTEGYNITFEDFNNIISEYQPGVLEAFAENGKLLELFSLDTFNKYRKEESFNDKLSPTRIEPDDLFLEISKKQSASLLRESFNSNFMLYYNLKKNHPEAFDLVCYVDNEISIKSLAGIATKIKISDLDLLQRNGCNFRMSDLFLLASQVTPEEYHRIIQTGKVEDLYSSKYEKNETRRRILEYELKKNGINFDDEFIEKNYRLINAVILSAPDIFKEPEISKYSMPEIFSAVRKLDDVKYRVKEKNNGKNYDFEYDSKTIIELLEYSRNTNLLNLVSEKEQLDVIERFAENGEKVKNSRFIEYTLKKNKPYETDNIDEILNYTEYCADQILLDNNIRLDDAKSKFLNSLFHIDVPEEYKADFEKEFIESLYYYQKYLPESELQKQCGDFINIAMKIFDSKNINEFKDLLYANKSVINFYNTNQIGTNIKRELMEFSKNDMVQKLQETSKMIENLDYVDVLTSSGKNVKAKILSGEKFYLATSTAMPECSYYSKKIRKDNPGNEKNKIHDAIMKANVFRNETCVSIISDEMVAHAGSTFPDQEVGFAYFPQKPEDISISAMYDLSTSRKNGKERTTKKPTTYRAIEDFTSGTIEEHNESVMRGIPDYIVCHDKITDVAIEKRDVINEQLKKRGIDKKVEILLVPSKDIYIPKIKEKLDNEYEYIIEKLNTKSLTNKDFENMFENHESNIVVRTLQAIHSTSYRDDTWDILYTDNMIRSLTYILEEITDIVPPEKSRPVLDQVNLLLERADVTKGFGTRYYDHNYSRCIDTQRLGMCKNILQEKNEKYENNKPVKSQNVDMLR